MVAPHIVGIWAAVAVFLGVESHREGLQVLATNCSEDDDEASFLQVQTDLRSDVDEQDYSAPASGAQLQDGVFSDAFSQSSLLQSQAAEDSSERLLTESGRLGEDALDRNFATYNAEQSFADEEVSLEAVKQQLQKERDRAAELVEYVRLTDSNNRRLGVLEEEHASDLAQYKFQNERLRSELAAIKKRCRAEIAKLLLDDREDSKYFSAIPACATLSFNGASPVDGKTSCDNACSKAEGVPCYSHGCDYKGGGFNKSYCACPIYNKRAVITSEILLCTDAGYDKNKAHSETMLSAIVMIAIVALTL